MEKELKLLSNQARFISAIISGEIKYIRRKMEELLQDIIDKGFDPILREGSLPVPDDEGEAAAAGESPDEEDPSSCYYEYLTSMPMRFFNDEYLQQHLLKRISEIKEAMRSSHTKHMDAQSDREATGNDCVPEAAATTPRRRCKRSAAESVPIDDDDNEEEAAAQLYDYLAAIVGLGPQQHAGNAYSSSSLAKKFKLIGGRSKYFLHA
nr:DNA topoisomerase 2-like [Aegilops tauschii subsp. strangulata]